MNGAYARAFNQRHGRRDHVFGRRFWSKVIESEEQYTNTLDYVLNNPSIMAWSGGPTIGAGRRRRLSVR